MEFFEVSSNWTVALGKTVVHSLWIGLLLLSALKITLQYLPGRYSLFRYRMATISLFIFTGIMSTVFLLLYAPLQNHSGLTQSAIFIPTLLPSIQDLTIHASDSPVILISIVCCYIYFAGIIVMLIRTSLSFSFVRQMKRNGVPIQNEWYDQFFQLKLRMGIRKNVALLESDRLNVPALVGLIKPAIIVPVGMFTHLSVDQVETLLVHELYHLKRLDFLVNLIQLLVEGLFFFNPAVWIISRIIRTERENCCDDRVIQSCGDPVVYARALFQLAGTHQSIHHLIPGAGGTDQFQLFNRIKRILNQTNMKTNIREKLFSLMLLAGGIIILFTVSGFSSGFSIIRHQDSRQETGPSPVTTSVWPAVKTVIVQDTVPAPNPEELERIEEKELEELKEEAEAAKKEALESIDWEEVKREVEAAKLEAMESIDWEELKREAEAAQREAMESIDWEEMKKEMAHTKIHLDSIMQDFDFDFDMEDLRLEIEESMKEMKEINWESMKKEIEESMKEMKEINWESMKKEIEESMEEIDWDAMKLEMEHMKIHVDSIIQHTHTD